MPNQSTRARQNTQKNAPPALAASRAAVSTGPSPRLVAPKAILMPTAMQLKHKNFALVDFMCKLPVKPATVLRESNSSAFLDELFDIILAAGHFTFLRLVGQATVGAVVDGFATLHQRFCFRAADADRLEEQWQGLFEPPAFATVKAAFHRVGGPRLLRRLVVGVPHYISDADLVSLLSVVPHVVSVLAYTARAAHAPRLPRGDAFIVTLRVDGPLQSTVPLVDEATGTPICTVRLDSIVPRQPSQPPPLARPRPAPPPTDPALPRHALWPQRFQQQHQQQRPATAAEQQQLAAAAEQQQPAAAAEQQQPAAAAVHLQQQRPAAAAQQQEQHQPAMLHPSDGAHAPAAPKRRPKATTGAAMGGGAPRVKVARLPGIEPGFFNRPQSSRQQGVQRAPQTMSEAALQYELEWRAQLAEMADMDMEAGASSASEYEEYGEDEDGHVSSCSD